MTVPMLDSRAMRSQILMSHPGSGVLSVAEEGGQSEGLLAQRSDQW